VIAGSKLLTFFDERGQASPGQWLERARQIAGPEQPVILVCRSGNRTRAASQFLSEQAGYRTVYNLSQGMNAWLGDKRQTIRPAAAMAVCPLGAAC
jgi:rhodanese-related sulfurtransferase